MKRTLPVSKFFILLREFIFTEDILFRCIIKTNVIGIDLCWIGRVKWEQHDGREFYVILCSLSIHQLIYFRLGIDVSLGDTISYILAAFKSSLFLHTAIFIYLKKQHIFSSLIAIITIIFPHVYTQFLINFFYDFVILLRK